MACVKLEGNADAVEFCPTPPYFRVLAAATYTLQQKSSEQDASRVGTLSLFTCSDCGDLQLHQTHLLHTCGIFDIKWKPLSSTSTPPVLAQAGADGSIVLYELQGLHSYYLGELTKCGVSSSMCLSLDWDPLSRQHISISHSDGGLSVVDIRESNVEVSQNRGDAHSFESWCVAYDAWRPDILYSGGDDCHFCCWDIRQGLFQPIFRETSTHRMGVCSIQSNPHAENLLATGSYDEKLRIWDTRILQQPIMEMKLGLGGGVWKVKWSPVHKGLLVAACMHNGFMVVRMQGHEVFVSMEYKRHASLAYGVDWFKGSSEGTGTELLQNDVVVTEENSLAEHFGSSLPLVASCSFYDCSLHLWRLDVQL